MKNNGLKIMSYFISDGYMSDSDKDTFSKMYGKDASFIDCTNMMNVAKSMNQEVPTEVMKYLDKSRKTNFEHVDKCRRNIPWSEENKSVAREIMLIFFDERFLELDENDE